MNSEWRCSKIFYEIMKGERIMYCFSISHKKAPASVREQFAFTAEQKLLFMEMMKQEEGVDGCVVLGTCNRSEIYISGSRKAISALQQRFAGFCGITLEEVLKYLNNYSGEGAIRHLFHVCCGFDSMVLGEDEILGQVKDAYLSALEQKTAGHELNILFQRAISCAKRIKTDTGVSRTPVSVATLAANEVFRLEKEGIKKVMIIGLTGKMGGSIARNILSHPGIEIIGTARSHRDELQLEWKTDRIRVIDYRNRYQYMDESDVIISATSGPHYTITCGELEKAVKTRKPRLFIDVALPMDIDSRVGKLEDTVLYDIDFFEALSSQNLEVKQRELQAAGMILEEGLQEAVKEWIFSPYLKKLEDFRQTWEGKSFQKNMFLVKEHAGQEELKAFLKIMDSLKAWGEEGH